MLNPLIEAAVPDPDGPGCALGLLQDGTLTTAHRGLANIEHRVPITADTVFHVASVSKQFTAYAVALLAADGALRFDDPVAGALPWFPFPDITIDQLIRHTSGLRDQWSMVEVAGRRMEDVITTGDVVRMVTAQRGLNFPPGTRYQYCNTGYTLLGLIVEAVSGQSLRDFCAERVFAPLGMTHTHFHDDHQEVVADRADSYSGRRRIALSYATAGATSLNTTVGDLALWAAHTMTPALRAVREPVPADGSHDYGLGVHVARHNGVVVVSHAGADAGYRSHFLVLPELGLAAIALANDANAHPALLCEAALDLALTTSPHSPMIKASFKSLELHEGRPDHGGAPPAPEQAVRQPDVAARQPDVAAWQPDVAALAGDYLDVELGCVYTLAVVDGTLHGVGVPLRPAEPGLLVGPEWTDLWLSVDGDGFRCGGWPRSAPSTWRRVTDPGGPGLARPGHYSSTEAGALLSIVDTDGTLILHRPTRPDTPLRRLTPDTYIAPLDPTWRQATLVFHPDTTLTLSLPGAANVEFHPLP